ncbi:MAG: radical SAM protein [Bacilli bacterium]|nr:radical SAM protein [Bacilli bacterium]
MRIAYSDIQFELTRKCNQNCWHCCRGESQNLDLSKTVIDAFFDKNEIYSIGTIKFSGGEPPLNGEILEYLVERLDEKKINLHSFFLSINGLIYSEPFVKALNKLNDYCKKISPRPRERCGILLVSQTQYHKPALAEVIEAYKKLSYFIEPTKITILKPEDLLPYGNAYKNNLTTNEQNLNEVTDYDKSIQLVEHQGETFLLFNNQYISSNGNILTDGCISYDMMDKYHIGNVCDKSMVEMYSDQPKMLKLKK